MICWHECVRCQAEVRCMQTAITRVMLVEDKLADVEVVQRCLSQSEHAKYDLCHVVGGSAAVAQLRSGGYDVLLLGLDAPEFIGLESVRRIHEAHPEIPIVVLTTAANETLAL